MPNITQPSNSFRNDIKTLIQTGENLTTEFKSSKSKLNKDIYETVCAFLNRDGGDILLGVSDDGIIVRINEDKTGELRQDFLSVINNPRKLNPLCYLSADIGEIDPENFMPYPKNPTITKVFREIGYAEELGSGVKNLYRYSKLYGGSDPKLVEDDIFTTTISLLELDGAKTKQNEHPSTTQTKVKTRVKIIEKIKLNPNITNQALASELELTLKGIEWQMKKLKEEKIIERIGSARSGYWEVTGE